MNTVQRSNLALNVPGKRISTFVFYCYDRNNFFYDRLYRSLYFFYYSYRL